MKNMLLLTVSTLIIWNTEAKENRLRSYPKGMEQHLSCTAYSFKNESKNHFKASNSQNNFSCTITPTGYTINHLITAQHDLWSAEFSIAKISSKTLQLQGTAMPDNNTLIYHYSGADVRYTNNNHGLRQDFIVNKKPAGKNALNIIINITSSLKASLKSNNHLTLSGSDGKECIVYDDLHVWDAHNKVLPASFTLKGNELAIVVDDAQATYPITVDPLTRQPEWTTSANGLLSNLPGGEINAALYGYSVADVGDINGDGFGDLAVGAPGLASVLGTGPLAQVGAVFIFYGSANGASATPDAVLQPTTAVAGALFGYSIDGEDIDGDGLSDLIIGAPLDQASVNVGAGPVNATLGKVYYYSGASLSNPNATPLLTLGISNNELSVQNIGTNALFGFSLAVTDDLNGDGDKDIIVGAPGFSAAATIGANEGGAFVFYSDGAGGFTNSTSLTPPTLLAGMVTPIPVNIDQLQFGYSVDGAGDYNGDGEPDVVVGAPGGGGISSIANILTGQIVSGRAVVYYGAANAISPAPGTQLYSAGGTLLANSGNLFGFSVKGLRDISGNRTGSIVVGAPLAGTIDDAHGLTIQTGSVQIFLPNNTAGATALPNQVLESPRSSTLLGLLETYNLNALMGASIDNMYDANGDAYPDLIVGEPLSTGTNITGLQAAATGGSAYVYAGNSTGGFDATPIFDVTATYGTNFASINAVPLFGYSVAGVHNLRGPGTATRVLVGSPAASLDFSAGLLNLGSTLNSLFDFAAGDDGPGSAYIFDPNAIAPLPVHLLSFKGTAKGPQNFLIWKTAADPSLAYFELQRSNDGKAWQLLDKVSAKNAGAEINYEVTDASPVAGVNYYRLKMIYKDSKSGYSQTIVLHNELTLVDVQIYPNPVTEILQISTLPEYIQSLRVLSSNGSVVKTQSVDKTQEVLTFTKDELGMNIPGNYLLEINKKDGSVFRKMIVSK